MRFKYYFIAVGDLDSDFKATVIEFYREKIHALF